MSTYKLTEQTVLAALAHVEEPDLKRDLVSLEMVKNIDRKSVV